VTAPAAGRIDARAALEQERAFLLRSLDDLEREWTRGDLADDDYRALKDDYTARAARVLRALEEGGAERAPAETVTPAPAPARRGRTVLVGAAVAAFAVAAGLAVASASGSRLPGDTLTGEIRETSASRLQQAAALARQGEVTEALRRYDEVLADDPDNVEALSERGLLLISVASASGRPALAAEGRASIERTLELRPGDPRGLFYLGLALRLQGDDAAATETFREALAADPPPALRQAIEEFLASIGEDLPPVPPVSPDQP
jgi:tetratricopeptide (TPR) repeat protein